MRIPKNLITNIKIRPSLPFGECLAKTWNNGRTVCGRTVESHCRIAGNVAEILIYRFNQLVLNFLPNEAFIPALLHDIGKVCPTFQKKLRNAIDNIDVKKEIPELAGVDPEVETSWHGHAAVSGSALKGMGAPESLVRITGSHHGQPSKVMPSECLQFGGHAWQEERVKLVHLLMDGKKWSDFASGYQERIVAGLTVVADWIASGPLFDDPGKDWNPLVEEAVKTAGFFWPEVKPGLSFKEIFGFEPRPAQETLYNAVKGPGVYILEAPMGVGKTEAALYAAYRMITERKSYGLYFALPTRLTANKIYERVSYFLSQISGDNSGPKVSLLHSTSWLQRYENPEFGREGGPEGSWFNQGKKGILAPYAVGTVDQALMSVMHVRFGALRTFGLAGKTVILDEVHSYDAYTGTLLDELVRQLVNCKCTVIILSATLTGKRREKILNSEDNETSYPLISSAPVSGKKEFSSCSVGKPYSVCIMHSTDQEAVEEALLRSERGEKVLWVENTVAQSQNIYELLSARASAMENIQVGLLHSCFTQVDRQNNESIWTARYSHHAETRGRQGAILIGTQVVEQSLDIDADFLISRFCPSDMLLQRIGRLWRHDDTPRPTKAKREVWLLHPDMQCVVEDPENAFGLSGKVYEPYILYRTLLVWEKLKNICLPNQIRDIIEDTYCQKDESDEKIRYTFYCMNKKIDQLRSLALRNSSDCFCVADDNDPPTRINTQKKCPVLLVRRFNDPEHIVLADGTEIQLKCTEGSSQTRWHRRSLIASHLVANIVNVPEFLAPDEIDKSWIERLTPWVYTKGLRMAVLEEDGSLFRLDGVQMENNIFYDSTEGYRKCLL